MYIKRNDLLPSTRWSIVYIVVIPVVACIFAGWNAYQRINEFEQAHYRIAKSTTAIVASEISKRIKDQQRRLGIFAKHEEQLLYSLAQSPENETLKNELNKRVKESFPTVFGVSIANQKGIPIIDDFDGVIGYQCQKDLKLHAQGQPQPMRIHPNTQQYHIDIIVPWNHDDGKPKNEINSGLLFVSFTPDFLFRLLELSNAPRHELMLVNHTLKNLIEVTATGTRIELDRNNFVLTDEEQQRILFSSAVENSAWDLVDFRDKTLFSEYRNNIISFHFLLLTLFVFVSILMVVLLLRIEKRRINAEETKEEMFSLFNHDLRSPLTSIFGFLELFTRTDLCEKTPVKCKHLARIALDNSLAMREIVDDILDVQKMEAGEMPFNFEEIEIVATIKHTIEMNEQHAKMNKINLFMLSDESAVYIKADKRRIKQVITNLLSNAIKYSPENEIVTVSIGRNNTGVTISVSDNGPGIEEDFQKLVFNKFAQSKSKLTRHVGGTGLGLAIVKHIIDAHKGNVTFKTDPDKGTTFTISLLF
ncbi:MAG: HAMP domain-containing histidine kinase [Gammaproteobacteria bacterium]|nr:HAMP domain-containing histidine kinase [Gammaproteobacteria bacterium]